MAQSAQDRPIRTFQDYYEFIMDANAKSHESIIFRLAPNDPSGDFANTTFAWTEEQKQAWLTNRIAPIEMKDMPADTKFATHTFHGVDGLRRTADGQWSLAPEAERRIREATGAMACVFFSQETKCVALVPRQYVLVTAEKWTKEGSLSIEMICDVGYGGWTKLNCSKMRVSRDSILEILFSSAFGTTSMFRGLDT